MSFQLNLAALTESARDRFTRLDTAGGAIRDRFRLPPPRLGSLSPGSTAVLEMGPSSESSFALRLSEGVCLCPLVV